MSCLLLASCSTRTARLSQVEPDIAQIPESWKPHLLYLLPSPHSRLCVELDAVEGCVPKQAALQKLRDFLSAYCNKPDGIEIVRSDVIPIKAARGISPRALARKYINGPDKITASPRLSIRVRARRRVRGGPRNRIRRFYLIRRSISTRVTSRGSRGASLEWIRRPCFTKRDTCSAWYADQPAFPAIAPTERAS